MELATSPPTQVNYHIRTDAIEENLIPQEITKQQAGIVYANKADLLNVALLELRLKNGRTAIPTIQETYGITLHWNSLLC